VALVALKRSAIQQLERDTLIRCLDVDARPFYARLSPQLDSDQRAFWDARLGTLDHGLNHCGWADRRLRIAAGLFRRLLQDECAIRTMLQMTDPDAQRRFYHRRWRNRRWRLLNAVAFSRPVLALLYRRGIVRHVPPDFGRIVEGRLERAFVGSPADENLYLWQALIGRYPPSSDRGLPAYLRIKTLPEVMSQLPRLHLECAEVGEWLVRQASVTLDFAALSNVTEVTSYEYTARLGEELARVGSPGALIVVRSIFPPTPPELDPLALRLTPVPEMARQLEQQDRSIVCAFIRVFRVER
jgi:S-adenosylmethionine:diacylglycerol 3-amino-3-carboxypropyl transferase